MNSWLPCAKWQHFRGSGFVSCLTYSTLTRFYNRFYDRFLIDLPFVQRINRKYLWQLKDVALVLTLAGAILWEVGQAILWPIDWPDTIGDLIADCAGIGVMWGMAV